MTISVERARGLLTAALKEADANHNKVISNKEIKDSGQWKTVKKVLNQAAARAGNHGGQTIDNTTKYINAICDEFIVADKDHNGALTKKELAAYKGAPEYLQSRLRALNVLIATTTTRDGGSGLEQVR